MCFATVDFLAIAKSMFFVCMAVVVTFMRMAMTFMRVTMRMTSVRMTMAVIMSSVRVTVVSMTKCGDPNKIDDEPKCTDGQKLANALHLASFYQSLDGFVDDFYADEPSICELQVSVFASFTYIKKMPLAKPAKVSTLPYP